MESFKWGRHFETGLTEIDNQHRQLVSILNNFGTNLTAYAITQTQLNDTFNKLAEYASNHFKEEEHLMAEMKIDSRHSDKHKKEHQDFLADVTRMFTRTSPSELDSCVSLHEFLIHWLAYHILGIDKKLARQIESIEGGHSPSEAFLIEDQDVSDSTEPLLVALNGLFKQISKRNKELHEFNLTLKNKVEERTKELSEANKNLRIIASTDALTDLPNRRYAIQQLQQLLMEADKLKQPLSCIMIDADGFKEVNDTFGHDAGDTVLIRLARELRQSVRSDDIVCRLGGDEFLIICPNTNLDGALFVAEQTRKNVEAMIVKETQTIWHGSVSIGVAVTTKEAHSVDTLLKAADKGVYLAKEDGKNCVRS